MAIAAECAKMIRYPGEPPAELFDWRETSRQNDFEASQTGHSPQVYMENIYITDSFEGAVIKISRRMSER